MYFLVTRARKKMRLTYVLRNAAKRPRSPIHGCSRRVLSPVTNWVKLQVKEGGNAVRREKEAAAEEEGGREGKAVRKETAAEQQSDENDRR